MVRVGRYTAALSLTVLGVLLLLDHAGSLDALRILRVWWPAALVALGVELIIVQSINREPGTRIRLSLGTLFGALVLGGFVLIASRGADFNLEKLHRWADEWNIGLFDSNRAKHSFDKGMVSVPVNDRITISNANGKVTLMQGPVSDIEVMSTVFVDLSDEAKASLVAEKSQIQVSNEDGVQIVAYGEPYGTANMRKPRMDIVVTFPQDRMPKHAAVHVGNGSVQIDGLPDGSMELSLDVKNGDVSGEQIGGTFQAKLFNGDIALTDLHGDANVETVNGDMTIMNPAAGITAKTVHGDIEIHGDSVGGNWQASSTMGDIRLAWPESAGVQVSAKTEMGDVSSDWPLRVTEHSASGKLGDGAWSIVVQTHMDIALERFTG